MTLTYRVMCDHGEGTPSEFGTPVEYGNFMNAYQAVHTLRMAVTDKLNIPQWKSDPHWDGNKMVFRHPTTLVNRVQRPGGDIETWNWEIDYRIWCEVKEQ